VWNPHLDKDIKLIEGVHRRATKLVHGIENWKYDDRLKFLGLTRLDKRKIRSDLVETFKILNGFYNINEGLLFDLDDGGRRGHEKKLFKRNFVWILGNLFLATGWLTIGIHYLHSVSIAAPLTHLRSMFQFNWSRNPVIIWKCDMLKVGDIGTSLCLLTPSSSGLWWFW